MIPYIRLLGKLKKSLYNIYVHRKPTLVYGIWTDEDRSKSYVFFLDKMSGRS